MAMVFLNNKVNVTGTYTNYTPVTATGWFYINTSKSINRLLGTDDVWEIRVTDVYDSAGSYRLCNEFFSSTVSPSPTRTTTVIASGTWYHFACSATKSGTAKVYLNGVLESTTTDTADTPTLTAMALGTRPAGSPPGELDGSLDDIRIYNRILSDDEILTIYSSLGADNIVEGLKNRWLLNEGADTVIATAIVDEMGNNDGTTTGSPTYTSSFLSKRMHNY